MKIDMIKTWGGRDRDVGKAEAILQNKGNPQMKACLVI